MYVANLLKIFEECELFAIKMKLYVLFQREFDEFKITRVVEINPYFFCVFYFTSINTPLIINLIH